MGPGTKYYNDWIMNANNTIFLKYQKIDDTKYFYFQRGIKEGIKMRNMKKKKI